MGNKPVGRPSKYDESFCDQVIDLGKQGLSITQIAFELDIHKDTLYDWKKTKPEFSDAIKKARDYAQGFWENALRTAALGMNPEGVTPNPTLMIFQMKNRCPDEWREKQVQEHVGKDDSELLIKWQS